MNDMTTILDLMIIGKEFCRALKKQKGGPVLQMPADTYYYF